MPSRRQTQIVLIASTVACAWLGMQVVHEAGHVLGAWATGGQIAKVVLHPLTISRTEIPHNPHPVLVVWAGPVVGALAPLLVWGIAAASRSPGSYLLRFFAGFCLVANGAYIGSGVVAPLGDAADMLHYGSPSWLLGAFGFTSFATGIWLWHRQGHYFGFGRAEGHVSRRAAMTTLACFLVLLALELFFGAK